MTARDRRLALGLAGLVAVAAAVAVAAIATTEDDPELPERSLVEEMSGIPREGLQLGRADAPVTVTVFGDLLSPAYQQLFRTALPPLITGPVAAGDVKLVYRHWNELGVQGATAARAALAASLQDRYWEYMAVLASDVEGVRNVWRFLDEQLEAVAVELGLDLERWRADRRDGAWDEHLRETARRAERRGFERPPAFVVEGPRGERELVGHASADRLGEAVEQVSR